MHKALRIAKRIAIGLTLTLIAVVLGAVVSLRFKPVRGFIRDRVLAAIRGSLKGELFVDDVRMPNLERIELSGVTLKDRNHSQVLALPSVQIDLHLRALLHGKLQIETIDIDHLFVDLADFGDQRGLLSVFASDPSKPSKPADPNADVSPIAVEVRALCLTAASVQLQPQPERRLNLHRIDSCLRLDAGRSLEVAIERLSAELAQNDRPALLLARPEALPPLAALAPIQPSAPGPMRAALSGKFRFRSAEDMAFDIRLGARSLSAQTLHAFGVAGDLLQANARVDADVHASSSKQRIAYRVEVRAPSSAAHVSGEFDDKKVLWTHLASERLELASFSSIDVPRLRFELDSQVDLSKSDQIEGRLNLVSGQYDDIVLPETSLRAGRREDETLTLRTLDARYGSAVLSASGQLAPNGSLQARAKLSAPELASVPPIKQKVPGLSGALTTTLSASRDARGQIDASLDLQLRELERSGQRADRVSLVARASGALRRPLVHAELQGKELYVSGQHIGQVDLGVDGGPDQYRVTGRADARRLALDGWVAEQDSEWTGSLDLTTDIGDAPIAVNLPLARFSPGKTLEVQKLRAHYRDASLFADGVIGLSDHPSRLRFGANLPDLAALLKSFGQKEVSGRIELAGSARGEIEKPSLDARLKYSNGPPLAGHASEARLHAQVDLDRATAKLELKAAAGNAFAEAKLDSRWRRTLPLAAALKVADHSLDLEFGGLSLASLLQPPDPDMRSQFDGQLRGKLNVRGNQNKLKLDTQIRATRLRAVADPTSLDLVVNGKYERGLVQVEMKAGDKRGQLASVEFSDDVELERTIQQPSEPLAIVTGTHWKAAAEFASRQVRELPVVSGLGVSWEWAPLTVSGTAHVEHQPHAEPVGEVRTTLRWEPLPGAAESGTCSDDTHGAITLMGELHDGQLGVTIEGGTRSDKAVELETGMHAKFEELLAGVHNEIGPLKFKAHVRDLDLATIPMLCQRGKGVLSAEVDATDLFYKLAEIKLSARGRHVQWDDSPPVEIDANAHAEDDHLRVGAKVGSGSGALVLDGRLPIGFQAKDPAMLVNHSGPLALKTHLQRIDAAALLAFAPGVKRVSGAFDGEIDVSGTLQNPNAGGSLTLDDVSFTLPRLGQRFSHLNMKAILANKKLRIEQGKVRDLTGSASFAAQLSMDSLDAWNAELNLKARAFPVRKSGVMMGRADLDAKVQAKSTKDNTDVSVALSNVSIVLTTSDIASVQSLEPHPDIVFADAHEKPKAQQEKEAADQSQAPPTHATINVETTEPLWIRRDDFAVQMAAKLKVVLGGGTPDMTGVIQLIRGYISLLGQSFDIKTGRVVLTGGTNIDPQLEITATHSTPSGTIVRLEVTGFVTHPELAFFVNDQSVTAGEALSAITGRDSPGGSSDSAQQALASAAMGMTTGLLSLGARREFGDWIPMLSIEQGDQTRVRVGFEADKLIPKFLRGFVRGAYVEGIVASGDSSNGRSSDASATPASATANTASGGGVLLELLLPKDFVWAGQYGPGVVWSVDLDWRP